VPAGVAVSPVFAGHFRFSVTVVLLCLSAYSLVTNLPFFALRESVAGLLGGVLLPFPAAISITPLRSRLGHVSVTRWPTVDRVQQTDRSRGPLSRGD
jgi:hypothetical protein